jgi:hypothetical protein
LNALIVAALLESPTILLVDVSDVRAAKNQYPYPVRKLSTSKTFRSQHHNQPVERAGPSKKKPNEKRLHDRRNPSHSTMILRHPIQAVFASAF